MDALQLIASGYINQSTALEKIASGNIAPVDALGALAMGYGLRKQAAVTEDPQVDESLINSIQQAQADKQEQLLQQLEGVPNPFPPSVPGVFNEDKSIGSGLRYLQQSGADRSWGPKSLSTLAQIATVALPTIVGGATASDSTLKGLARGALTGAGGLGGYYAGRALANSDWLKNMLGDSGDGNPSSLRFWAPLITGAGGAVLGNILGGSLLGKNASTAPIEKYASYYYNQIDPQMQKQALFRTIGRLAGVTERGLGNTLTFGRKYGGKALNWMQEQLGKAIEGTGNGLHRLGEWTRDWANTTGKEWDAALALKRKALMDNYVIPGLRNVGRMSINVLRPSTWSNIGKTLTREFKDV